MAIHFNPYPDSECLPDVAICGTLSGESSEESPRWDCVTCRRCINAKPSIIKWVEDTETNIIKQMGDQVDFENRANKIKEKGGK